MKGRLKILYATDFLESSKIALEMLNTLGEKYDTNLTFMHVVTTFWKDWFASGLYEKEAMDRLHEWSRKINAGEIDDSHLMVFKGNAADYITMQAGLMNADLIVVGGGGDPETKRDFITGSTAEEIIRYSRQSVFLVKKPGLKSILAAVDGSMESRKALEKAIELTYLYDATLKVVHVIPNPDFNPLGMKREDVLKNESAFKEEKINEIELFLKPVDFKGVKYEVSHIWGVASHAILATAMDEQSDVIVIGTTGHSEIEKRLLGTTATKTIRRAPCSVYVVR